MTAWRVRPGAQARPRKARLRKARPRRGASSSRAPQARARAEALRRRCRQAAGHRARLDGPRARDRRPVPRVRPRDAREGRSAATASRSCWCCSRSRAPSSSGSSSAPRSRRRSAPTPSGGLLGREAFVLPVLLLVLAGWMFRHPASVHDNGRIGIGFGLLIAHDRRLLPRRGRPPAAEARASRRSARPAACSAGCSASRSRCSSPTIGAYIVLGLLGVLSILIITKTPPNRIGRRLGELYNWMFGAEPRPESSGAGCRDRGGRRRRRPVAAVVAPQQDRAREGPGGRPRVAGPHRRSSRPGSSSQGGFEQAVTPIVPPPGRHAGRPHRGHRPGGARGRQGREAGRHVAARRLRSGSAGRRHPARAVGHRVGRRALRARVAATACRR